MKVIVLDRDGVINHDSDDYIKSVDEWIPIDGSIQAIAKLCDSGYRVMVATNQSGLARNLFDEYTLAHIHHMLCSMVEEAGGVIDGIFYCPHLPDEGCNCRKPGVGLLEQIELEYDCKLQGAYYIGDSFKDVEAALKFGCKPVLVRTGKGSTTEITLRDSDDSRYNKVAVYDDLQQAVNSLLASTDSDA